MRKEIYNSTLADRNRRQRWWKEGGKDIVLHAREKVDQILATQQGPILSNEVEKQFANYLKIIQKRTMDSYRIMEGLDNKASAPSSSKPEDE
jgi:trimethylamine:corrinoid methyltransferase-like protein